MAQFRFTLYDAANGATLLLRHPPIGWADSGVTLKRARTGGIQAEYTQQMEFVKEGKALLDTIYETRGAEAEVLFRCEEADVTQPDSPLRYVPFFEGRVNLSGLRREALTTTVNVEQKGFRQRLLAGMDTPLNLLGNVGAGPTGLPAGPPPGPRLLTLHSRGISRFYEGYSPAQPSPTYVAIDFTEWDNAFLTVGFNVAKGELDTVYTLLTGFGPPVGTGPPEPPVVNVFEAAEAGTYTIDFRLKGLLVIQRNAGGYPNGDFDEATVFVDWAIPGKAGGRLLSDHVTGIMADFNYSLNVQHAETLALAAGDKLYIWARARPIPTGIGFFRPGFLFTPSQTGGVSDTYLKITARTTSAPTTAPGLLYYEALTRAVELLTGEAGAVRSSLLQRTDTLPALAADGPWALMWAATGFQLRQFPLDKKPMTLTLGDLLDSFCALTGAAWALTTEAGRQLLRVEPYATFHPVAATPTLVFDFPADGVVSARTEAVYNEAEVGFQEWETQTVNGLDDTAARTRYALPISQAKAKYEALSKLIGSGYAIELTRRKPYREASAEDTARDTAGFVVLAVRSGVGLVAERIERFTPAGFAGIIAPADAYNLRLLPALILRRHFDRLAVAVARQAAPVLRFAAGQGNTAAEVQPTGGAVVGANDDVPAGAPPALPDTITCTVVARFADRQALLANPYQIIGLLTATGERLLGRIESVKIDPAGNTAALTLTRVS